MQFPFAILVYLCLSSGNLFIIFGKILPFYSFIIPFFNLNNFLASLGLYFTFHSLTKPIYILFNDSRYAINLHYT